MNWDYYFIYDAGSGNLIWKPRPMADFASSMVGVLWNAQHVGTVAGHRNRNRSGHPKAINVRLPVGIRKAHRIIYEMMVGPIPPGVLIDHKDGNPWNNRLENLRLATHAQNLCNKSVRPDNKVGLKGVDLYRGRYRAQIKVNGKSIHLGLFGTPELAHDAYCKASKEYHGEFSRTN